MLNIIIMVLLGNMLESYMALKPTGKALHVIYMNPTRTLKPTVETLWGICKNPMWILKPTSDALRGHETINVCER